MRLESLSPLKILDRGYAVVFDPEGKPVGLAVSGGFVQLIYVFLEQTLEIKLRVRGAK